MSNDIASELLQIDPKQIQANPSKVNDCLKPEKEYLGHLFEGKEFLSENYFSNLKNVETLD